MISIHALREEGDWWGSSYTPSRRISIHALREEGDSARARALPLLSKFLSTPSARRATYTAESSIIDVGFLSTPSARRATAWSMTSSTSTSNFYPRPPRGGRLPEGAAASTTTPFLSTPSARRATQGAGHRRRLFRISIHALREEGDRLLLLDARAQDPISIHALREEGDRGHSQQ